MSRTLSPIATLLAGSALALLPTPSHAADPTLPGRFAVGSDVNRDPCTATRAWTKGAGLLIESEQPFVITCRGSTEQRALIDVAVDRPILSPDLCGAPRQTAFDGLGPVTLRRCYDPRLAGESIVVETTTLRGSALASTLGPLVLGLRAARDGKVGGAEIAIDPTLASSLAAPAAGAPALQATATIAASGLDSTTAIKLGMQSIYAGRNVDASRLLNDAVAQFATESVLRRAELRLAAGLADSNIGEFGAAAAHFAAAQALLVQAPPSPARVRLEAQAITYKALDLANQGPTKAQAVLDTLDTAPANGFALTNPATLAKLNAGNASDLQIGRDTDQINQLILVAQGYVAQSNAHLALGRPQQAIAALQRAKVEGIDAAQAVLGGGNATAAGSLNWLRARLERQRGRILAASGDVDGALRGFDCAIAAMQAAAPRDGSGCLFPYNPATRGVPLNGPVIAEAELEQTAILATKPGVDRAQVMARYAEAVTTLTDASGGAGLSSPLLGRYLLMLVEDAAAGVPGAADSYFRALQIVREPGIAREYAALQSAVSNGAAGGMIRDRQDLERRRAQLRYEIGTLAPDAPRLAAARQERDAVSAQLEQVKADLAKVGVAAAVDDAPVDLATLGAGLRPGEAYLKLSEVGDRVFGAVVVAGRAPVIYVVDRPAAAVGALAATVLRSAHTRVNAAGRKYLDPFASDTSYELFERIAGPAAETLRQARALVLDTGSVLGGMPAGILVTAPTARAKSATADQTATPFLVRKAQLASALSPRAFMRVRGLAASRAPERLIGFGQNAVVQAPATSAIADTMIAVAPTCSVAYGRWSEAMRGNPPISANEIGVAARGLGAVNAPIVKEAAFNDAAIMRDSRDGKLKQYQVLHFATHGIPATPVPELCATPLPPSLITSLEPPTAPDAPSPSNGLLSYIDVARLDLDANLVVLSACETGTSVSTAEGRLAGQEESAPTLDGLVRAFIVAQARAVIATSWRVPASNGTEALIESLYRNGRTETMGQALQQAQIDVLDTDTTSHPYYWGAFFLVGDGAKTMLTKDVAVASR